MTDPAVTAPGPLRARLLIAILLTLLVGLVAVALTSTKEGDRGAVPASTPAATATAPPATAPATPATSTTPAAFPSQACQPTAVAEDSALGIGIPRPSRLATPGPEGSAFTAADACFAQITGQQPVLRTQLPIDAMRRTTPADDEAAEVTAFAALLVGRGSSGVVSIRAHDFTQCKPGGAHPPVEVASLDAGEPLAACQYPTPALYRELFSEIAQAMGAAAPGVSLQYTAWNEPDHPDFTLRPALGDTGAATRAGEYWAQAAGVVGADHLLAGEFADRDLPTLLRLRAAFVQGTGGVAPPAWAIHPYRDFTTGPSGAVLTGFAKAVAPAPVWDTEVGPRLSGKEGIGADADRQFSRGTNLRHALALGGRRTVLYLLTPPPPPAASTDDHWDSALADREGRARPFICGLAGLPKTDCPGNPDTYG